MEQKNYCSRCLHAYKENSILICKKNNVNTQATGVDPNERNMPCIEKNPAGDCDYYVDKGSVRGAIVFIIGFILCVVFFVMIILF